MVGRTFTALTIAAAIFVCGEAQAEINLDRIAQIESSGNPRAVSPAGCRGLFQISDITRRDFNNLHPAEQYTPDDLFRPEVSRRIGAWMMRERIPQMLHAYRIPDSVLVRIAVYNWGIGNVRRWVAAGMIEEQLPKETRNYYAKYMRAR